MPRLIVNADDFGMAPGVNRAILELHAAEVLTSATMMARAAATEEAVKMALAMPTLGVGCHVVLVNGAPTSDPARISSLIDSNTGALYPTIGEFLKRLYSGRIRPSQIEAEAAAQIASLQSFGLRLTHVDTHKHLHMFPGVLGPVLRAARAAGIRAIRNPFEPLWSINATVNAPDTRRAEVLLLRRLERRFRRIVAREGFVTTDGSVGVLATGTLDLSVVHALISSMPDGTFEFVSHPGYRDEALARANTRLLESREIERNALVAIKGYAGLELVSFAGLHPTAQQPVT
ncbi:ChbG/HpnK family deacetylase [Occallatibacter savannae]|uniref:ChbG/HpnK family deacetylase n=1 Tax=Occallatibacter savannae TaxID=1002691 RepID=UPI001EF40373|nr:ChbG/HpnK family deacetylase [Occallatibacter savannae]